MAILRVDCIASENVDGDQRIEALGGEGFHHKAETAILNIKNNIHTYYTVANGEVALIDIRKHPVTGKPFLQIIAKSYSSGDLTSLPDCR